MRRKDVNRRTELLWAAAIIMIGLTSLLFVNLIQNYKNIVLESQKNQLMNIAEAVSHSMEVYLEEYQMEAEEIARSDWFHVAENACMDDDYRAMDRVLEQAKNGRPEAVARVEFLKQGKGCVSWAGDPMEHRLFRELGGDETFPDITINKTADGRFSFGLRVATDKGNQFILYVDSEKMFEKTSEYLQMGENGYVMIKDSGGIILMHQVQAQIGIDVLADRKRQYPDFDFSELEVLIAHQLEGRTDVETYNSYWWADEHPRKTKKVSSYMPLHLGDDFLVVSAVIDYREVAGQIESEAIRIMIIMAAILIIGFLLFFYLRTLLIRQKVTENENKDLRRMNADLEKRRQEEEQQAHQQRLELIGTMTSGIAHEFNNLLTPIMGYSAMILAGMDETDDNYEDMKEIADTAEKAKEIISQINRFSSRGAEQMMAPIHVSEALRKALVITEAAKRRNITMVTAVSSENDICIGNPLQIEQIVINLCNNSIQAIGDNKGRIEVTGGTVKAEETGEKEILRKEGSLFYRIEVRDTGMGMDEETLNQIFVPFFTTKRPGEGTGLGLAVVLRMVEAHSGYICVSSTPGEGTSFRVYLPIRNTAEELVEQS